MALDFINYQRLREGNKEFTRADLWELSFLNTPKCYFPGKDFINQRCTGVNPGVSGNMSEVSHNIRGFQIHQAGRQTTNGNATLSFVDREDLAIRTWLEEWKQLMAHRDTTKGARKADYCCDIEIVYYNTSRNKIASLILYNCMLQDATPQEDGTNDVQSNSEISVSLAYEHYTREYFTRGGAAQAIGI